ncbi:hypothetical protein Y1Q_0011416 [Alligator mississippiensis]|uniref:Uncharacterized protein n=1 Tax=Alligator mississippiensis TaxID=8496 RepID=A0A151PJ74_ALLMI|nr:hypothetical protein Y1Q_0011416 [Alligator mississippiensis]
MELMVKAVVMVAGLVLAYALMWHCYGRTTKRSKVEDKLHEKPRPRQLKPKCQCGICTDMGARTPEAPAATGKMGALTDDLEPDTGLRHDPLEPRVYLNIPCSTQKKIGPRVAGLHILDVQGAVAGLQVP